MPEEGHTHDVFLQTPSLKGGRHKYEFDGQEDDLGIAERRVNNIKAKLAGGVVVQPSNIEEQGAHHRMLHNDISREEATFK